LIVTNPTEYLVVTLIRRHDRKDKDRRRR
jgi:hypothetical protein